MKIQRVNSLDYPSLEPKLLHRAQLVDELHQRCLWSSVHRFAVLEGDRPLGALSLLEVKHPVFGHYLATAPFGNYRDSPSRIKPSATFC